MQVNMQAKHKWYGSNPGCLTYCDINSAFVHGCCAVSVTVVVSGHESLLPLPRCLQRLLLQHPAIRRNRGLRVESGKRRLTQTSRSNGAAAPRDR